MTSKREESKNKINEANRADLERFVGFTKLVKVPWVVLVGFRFQMKELNEFHLIS